MTRSQGFLAALTVLNIGCAAISLNQVPSVNAAPASEVTAVVRTRHLEVVDGAGRARFSITVYPATTPEKESVVLRLINPDGMPGVKLATGDGSAGMALIARQGDYSQLFAEGLKVTKGGKPLASFP